MLASTFFLIVGIAVGVGVTGGAAAITIPIVTRKKRAENRLLREYQPSKAKFLPKEVDVELTGLRADLEWLVKHEEFKTATALSSVISLSQELFSKLKNRGDEHQLNLAAISYGNILAKLNKALSPDYFFDMLENPEQWENVEDRRIQVRNAVKAANAELLEAIRTLNTYTDMDYGVAIESILRNSKVGDMLSTFK